MARDVSAQLHHVNIEGDITYIHIYIFIFHICSMYLPSLCTCVTSMSRDSSIMQIQSVLHTICPENKVSSACGQLHVGIYSGSC